MVLDKTGTLTVSKPSLTDVFAKVSLSLHGKTQRVKNAFTEAAGNLRGLRARRPPHVQ